MIWGPTAVKHSYGVPKNPAKGSPKGPVWLEGWTLAIPSVGIALIATLLAVPRATEPKAVPQPAQHRWALDHALRQLNLRAKRVETEPLSFSVRETGEAYRRLGRTQYEGPQSLGIPQTEGWQRLIHGARVTSGDEALLTLRAVQAALLVNALHDWEATGTVSEDLVELGGDFVGIAKNNRWWVAGRLNMSVEERYVLALVRWTTLAGFNQLVAYKLDRDLELVQLRFFFDHPTPAGTPFQTRLKIIKRYSELEPSYPLEYARGVLFAQAGQYDRAFASFTRQLQEHPEGNYALRARNHLIWTNEQLRKQEGDDAP